MTVTDTEHSKSTNSGTGTGADTGSGTGSWRSGAPPLWHGPRCHPSWASEVALLAGLPWPPHVRHPWAPWCPTTCVHTHSSCSHVPCCVPGSTVWAGGAASPSPARHPGGHFHPLCSSTPGTERVTCSDALSQTAGHTGLGTAKARCEVVHSHGLPLAHHQGSDHGCAPLCACAVAWA